MFIIITILVYYFITLLFDIPIITNEIIDTYNEIPIIIAILVGITFTSVVSRLL